MIVSKVRLLALDSDRTCHPEFTLLFIAMFPPCLRFPAVLWVSPLVVFVPFVAAFGMRRDGEYSLPLPTNTRSLIQTQSTGAKQKPQRGSFSTATVGDLSGSGRDWGTALFGAAPEGQSWPAFRANHTRAVRYVSLCSDLQPPSGAWGTRKKWTTRSREH